METDVSVREQKNSSFCTVKNNGVRLFTENVGNYFDGMSESNKMLLHRWAKLFRNTNQTKVFNYIYLYMQHSQIVNISQAKDITYEGQTAVMHLVAWDVKLVCME